ncbi:hypothetical protein [Micromonospora tulbaghiae]|uniref:hypothetical protein n=1 Tax=Micromonospora tulbaghiae TaxID=479978 RepID=UPI0034007493
MRKLTAGDLAFWLTDDRRPVRCRVELVTAEHVYLRSTATDHGRRLGEVWREARYSRRVCPRDVVYLHEGRVHFDLRSFVIAA